MAAREACEMGDEQQASSWSCCALPPLSTRLSRGSSASGRVEHGARRCCPTRLHRRRGEGKRLPSPLQRWQRDERDRRATISNQAVVAVALYRRPPRLSRGSSASGHFEHGAEMLPDAAASAARRGEAFPLASPTMAAIEACETGDVEQQASTWSCCALPPLSTRLSRGSSASERVEHGVEVLPVAAASAARRGEAFPLASPTMAARSMPDG
jgi:hypothetical protein